MLLNKKKIDNFAGLTVHHFSLQQSLYDLPVQIRIKITSFSLQRKSPRKERKSFRDKFNSDRDESFLCQRIQNFSPTFLFRGNFSIYQFIFMNI